MPVSTTLAITKVQGTAQVTTSGTSQPVPTAIHTATPHIIRIFTIRTCYHRKALFII